MSKNIILCGVGGQGTVLASKLISKTAMRNGFTVRSAETIGMAQRGGSVMSHIRFGEDVHSPMVALKSADLIIAFEPGEAVRMLPYLKTGGTVITADRGVMPVTASLSASNYDPEAMLAYLKEKIEKLVIVRTDEALSALGSPKVLNILLLGAALKEGVLGISKEALKETILKDVNPRFHELNLRALDYYSVSEM